MADSQYPYPPDRFDDEADAVSFHGAHRAELPFWRENLLYIIIIGAAVVMLIVLLFLIGGMGGNGDERADDPTTSAAESSEAPAEEPADEEAEPAAEPDLTTPVQVVNAGGINGLAGTWQEALEGDGWEDVSVSTADNVQQEPVVFYRDAEDADSAQALAEQVGAGEARQSDEYDARITFVAVAEPGSGDEAEAEGDGEG